MVYTTTSLGDLVNISAPANYNFVGKHGPLINLYNLYHLSYYYYNMICIHVEPENIYTHHHSVIHIQLTTKFQTDRWFLVCWEKRAAFCLSWFFQVGLVLAGPTAFPHFWELVGIGWELNGNWLGFEWEFVRV